jgi:hypothetical protein
MQWLSGGVFVLAGLLASNAARAAIYTVGSTGTYTNLQAAVDDASGVPGSHEIRVRAQTVNGTTLINLPVSGVNLHIRGGWNDTFTQQIAGAFDVGATRLSGVSADTTVRLAYSQGEVRIEDLRIADGQGNNQAGGLHADLDGTASLTLDRVSIESNAATTTVFGGGAAVIARGQAQATLRNTFIAFNTLFSSNAANGAGVYLSGTDTAQVLVEGCVIINNSASAVAGFARPGAYLQAAGSSTVRLRLSDIGDNSTPSVRAGGQGIDAIATGSGQIILESLRVTRNLAPAATMGLRTQVYLGISDGGLGILSDSLIADGDNDGATVAANNTASTFRINNVSIARNPRFGLIAGGTGIITMYNSIVHGNAFNASLVFDASGNNLGNNLGLADPRFVDAATGDYRVRADSPAIDAGNMSPPAGLGQFDVLGATRVQGFAVDIGAYERAPTVDEIFRNGYE